MATSGDFLMATCEDFLMATDSPLRIPGGGIKNDPCLAVIRSWGRRPVTCTNAENRIGSVGVRT